MHMLDKGIAKKHVEILSNSYYNEWVKYFEKLLRLTRQKNIKTNGEKLLGIQLGFAKIETELWKNAKEGRNRAKNIKSSKKEITSKDKNDLKNYEKHIFINDQLIRISRTICDGIAWRNMRYNRTFLNSASRGNSAGAVNIEDAGFKGEFRQAQIVHLAFKGVVLLNDITRFLRVGDLTEINKNGIFIHEIKENGKRIKNLYTLFNLKESALLSDQDKRMLELQRIALSDTIKSSDQEIKTRKFKTRLKSNLPTLRKLIKRSEKEIVASTEVEGCLIIEVTNYEALILKADNVDFNAIKKKSGIIGAKNMPLICSNFDTFFSDEKGSFLRSVAPYSIFPMSTKQCLKLMSGQYLIQCGIDIEKFKKILESRGWETEMITEKELDSQLQQYEDAKSSIFSKKKPLYDFIPDQKGMITIKRGPFSFSLTPEIHSRITMELMSIETLLELLEEMYSVASQRKRGDIYFISFSNENEIWN